MTPTAGRSSGAARSTDDGRGPVEPGAHFYRSYQLDAHGNPINKRNAWQTRSLLYVRLIPPGAADVAHYRLRIPKDVKGPLTFTARLQLPQVRALLHAVRLRRSAACLDSRRARSARASTSREFSFDAANIPANVSGRIKDRDSGSADHHAGDGDGDAAGGRRLGADRVAAGRRQGRAASAGTTGASGCCCKAT